MFLSWMMALPWPLRNQGMAFDAVKLGTDHCSLLNAQWVKCLNLHEVNCCAVAFAAHPG